MSEITLEELKKEIRTTVERDSLKRASDRVLAIKQSTRFNKFKLSEKDFIREMANQGVAGEFFAAERILRLIESDPSVDTRDIIRGELHLFILDTYNVLRRRMGLKEKIGLEDLIYGKYATRQIATDCQI